MVLSYFFPSLVVFWWIAQKRNRSYAKHIILAEIILKCWNTVVRIAIDVSVEHDSLFLALLDFALTNPLEENVSEVFFDRHQKRIGYLMVS